MQDIVSSGGYLLLQRIKEKYGKMVPYLFFGWKAMNDTLFKDEVLSMQSLKSFFVHLLWLGTKLFCCEWS